MSTHKSLIKATLLFSVLSILQPLANFLLLPVYTRFFGTENFGLLSILNNISAFFSILSGLNIAASIIAFYKNYKTEEEVKRFISSVITFSFYTNLAILLVFCVWSNGFSGLMFYQKVDFYPNVFYAIFFGLFSNAGLAYLNFLKYQKQLGRFTLLTVIQFLAILILQYLFVVIFGRGLTGAMEAKAITTIFIMVIVFSLLRNHIFRSILFRTDIYPQLRYAIYTVPAAFIGWLGSYSDRTVIERFVHDNMYTLGLYSMVATICALIDIGIIALNSAFQPYLFDAFVEENKRQTANFFKMFLAASILIVTGFILLGSNIQFMVKNRELADSLMMVPLMGSGYVFSGLATVFGLRITYTKKASYYLYVSSSAVAINLLLNFLFISPLGIYGIIIAGIVSKLVMCVTMIYFAEKCAPSNIWKMLLLVAIISFCIIASTWLLYYHGYVNLIMSVILQMLGNMVLILTFIKPQSIWNLFIKNTSNQ